MPSRLLTATRNVERHKLEAPMQSSTSVCKLIRTVSIRFALRLAIAASRESALRVTMAARKFVISVASRAAAALLSAVYVFTHPRTSSHCDVKSANSAWASRSCMPISTNYPSRLLRISSSSNSLGLRVHLSACTVQRYLSANRKLLSNSKTKPASETPPSACVARAAWMLAAWVCNELNSLGSSAPDDSCSVMVPSNDVHRPENAAVLLACYWTKATCEGSSCCNFSRALATGTMSAVVAGVATFACCRRSTDSQRQPSTQSVDLGHQK